MNELNVLAGGENVDCSAQMGSKSSVDPNK